MSQSNFLELAKQGDASAITTLLNRSFQPKGITAKATFKDSCLQIMLESAQVPDQRSLVAFMQKSMKSLAAKSIERVKVYGRQTGEEFPAWSQEFELAGQVNSTTSSVIPSSNISSNNPQNVNLPKISAITTNKYTNHASTTKTTVSSQILIKGHSSGDWGLVLFLSSLTAGVVVLLENWILALIIFFFLGIMHNEIYNKKSLPKIKDLTEKYVVIGCELIAIILIFISIGIKPQPIIVNAPLPELQTQVDNTGQVSGNMCVENFNRLMSPSAYANLDKGSKTISISLSSETAYGQEFDSIANSMASSIFSSCTDVFVQTVSVSNGSSIIIKNR